MRVKRGGPDFGLEAGSGARPDVRPFMLDQARIGKRLRDDLQRRKNDLIYLLARTGLAVSRLFPHTLGLAIGGCLGGLAYHLLSSERRRVLEHLAIAFGGERTERERRGIAKACFRNLGVNLVEMVNLPRLQSDLDRYVEITGLNYLDRALDQGKGVLVITAHLGNWELMACYMARRGYPLNVVARKVYDERLNRLLLGFRERHGLRVILRESPTAGRQILQALKKGELLAMLIDQDTKVKGVMADFFGRRANTPAGPAVLAGRRGVPVLAMFIRRVSRCGHRIDIQPPVEIERTDDFARDVLMNTERFNRIIEQQIRQVPQQWVWNHRRWRRQVAYQSGEEHSNPGSLSL